MFFSTHVMGARPLALADPPSRDVLEKAGSEVRTGIDGDPSGQALQ
jgi:hypothetical protein